MCILLMVWNLRQNILISQNYTLVDFSLLQNFPETKHVYPMGVFRMVYGVKLHVTCTYIFMCKFLNFCFNQCMHEENSYMYIHM
jgi:hypothetical protein